MEEIQSENPKCYQNEINLDFIVSSVDILWNIKNAFRNETTANETINFPGFHLLFYFPFIFTGFFIPSVCRTNFVVKMYNIYIGLSIGLLEIFISTLR